MLDAGVIQLSISESASAPVLIRKRDGQFRWCVDYRAVNAVTTKEVYPLSLIEECLHTLGGNIWFSKLNAKLCILVQTGRKLLSFQNMGCLTLFARLLVFVGPQQHTPG